MIKGFREFVLRGNVLDLAVGIVIGVAFTGVIDALVKGFINPLIAAIFGKPNLNSVGAFTINHADFSIGLILTGIINFVLVAAALYFFVVVPANALRAKYQKPSAEAEALSAEVQLLTEIRDSLRSQA
jgi:large conductance mechanosensitive channel